MDKAKLCSLYHVEKGGLREMLMIKGFWFVSAFSGFAKDSSTKVIKCNSVREKELI